MKRIAITTHNRIKNERLDYLCEHDGYLVKFQDFVPITQYLIGSDNGVFWNIFYYYDNNYCDGGITTNHKPKMPKL